MFPEMFLAHSVLVIRILMTGECQLLQPNTCPQAQLALGKNFACICM